MDAIVRFACETIAEIKDVDVGLLSERTLLFSDEEGIESLNFDSLEGLELAMALEERYELDLREDVDYRFFRTIQSVADYVLDNISRE